MQFQALRHFVRVVLILIVPAIAASQQAIEVSPAGPIKTLAEARDAARAQRKAGVTGAITITIHAGTYFLPETLVLTPDDSNTAWEAAHGEHPIISGGRIIKGWNKSSADIWTADARGPYFYQLFVNGNRATRTRNPPYGFFRFLERLPLAICIGGVVGQVSFVLVAERVLTHVDSAQAGHPEHHAQALVSPF